MQTAFAAVVVALALCSTLPCALGKVFPAPKPSLGFSADVEVESSMIPVKRGGRCYWDYEKKMFRLDTNTSAGDYIDIVNFNNATRTIGRFYWFEHRCTSCFLDTEVNPLFVPDNAVCSTEVEHVNSIQCHPCEITVGPVEWTFLISVRDKSIVLQTKRKETHTTGIQTTTWTFSNVSVGPQKMSLFDVATTVGPKCTELLCNGLVNVVFVINNDMRTGEDLISVKSFIKGVVSWFNASNERAEFILANYSSLLIRPTVVKGGFIESLARLSRSYSLPTDFISGFVQAESASSRVGTDQVVIVLADHDPLNYDSVLNMTLKYQQVGEIYIIGYNGVNDAKMKRLASPDNNPLQPHYFKVSSAMELPDLVPLIAASACKNDNCKDDA